MAGKKLPVTLTGEVAELRRQVARLRVPVAAPAGGGLSAGTDFYLGEHAYGGSPYNMTSGSLSSIPADSVDDSAGTAIAYTTDGFGQHILQLNEDGWYGFWAGMILDTISAASRAGLVLTLNTSKTYSVQQTWETYVPGATGSQTFTGFLPVQYALAGDYLKAQVYATTGLLQNTWMLGYKL